MEVLLRPPLTRRNEGVEVVRVVRVARVARALIALTNLLPAMEKERKRMDFLAKSTFLNSEAKRATLVMQLKPSDSGLGALPTIETIMKTHT